MTFNNDRICNIDDSIRTRFFNQCLNSIEHCLEEKVLRRIVKIVEEINNFLKERT